MKRALALGLLIFLSLAASGQETQTVICSGTGKDQGEAEKAALRSAVEQAVGALVDADTLVKNDEVVNNQVLSHSDGFVEKWEPVGEPKKSAGGETTVKIKAVVRRNKLIEKLKEAKVTVKDVDGKSLFGEAITKMEGKESATALLKKAFEGIPENLLVAEIRGQKIIKEGDPATIELEIEVKFDWEAYSKKFLPNLQKVLEQICKKKSQTSTITQGGPPQLKEKLTNGIRFSEFREVLNDLAIKNQMTENCFFVNSGRNKAGDNLNWNWFILDGNLSAIFKSEISMQNAKLRLQFVGKDDQNIREDEVKAGDDRSGEVKVQPGSPYDFALWQENLNTGPCAGNSVSVICPFFAGAPFYGYSESLKIKWQAFFSLEELKQLKKIKGTFVPFKVNFGRYDSGSYLEN